METKTLQVGWKFVFQWVVATVIGFILFAILISILGDWLFANAIFFFGFLVLFPGMLIGITQSWVIRRYFDWAQKWERASTFIYGYTFIRSLVLIIIFWLAVNNYMMEHVLIYILDSGWFILPGAIFGAMIGLDFQNALKNKIRLSKWWVIANSMSWAICFIPMLIIMILLVTSLSTIKFLFWAICIIGLIIGFFQGITLFFEMRSEHFILDIELLNLGTESK